MSVTTEDQIDVVTVIERDQGPVLVTVAANTPDAADRENTAEETLARGDLIRGIATEIEEIVIEEIVSLAAVEMKMAPKGLKKAALKIIPEE